MNTERDFEIYEKLGEELVNWLADYTKGEAVNFNTVKKAKIKMKILEEIAAGRPYALIADKYGVSRMMVYRIEKESRKIL